jgi:hypothetical protein
MVLDDDVDHVELNSEWEATEGVLQRLKHSCFAMHLLYRRRFLEAKRKLAYYDVPIIVLSAINSVLIAGGKGFIPPQILQVMTCFLAVAVGIIQAVKNYFKIDENRESCLVSYKDLFKLFCEISLLLDQPRYSRGIDPRKYTIDKGNEYQTIMNKSMILDDNRAKRNPIYEDGNPYSAHRSGLSQLFHDVPASDGSEDEFRMFGRRKKKGSIKTNSSISDLQRQPSLLPPLQVVEERIEMPTTESSETQTKEIGIFIGGEDIIRSGSESD